MRVTIVLPVDLDINYHTFFEHLLPQPSGCPAVTLAMEMFWAQWGSLFLSPHFLPFPNIQVSLILIAPKGKLVKSNLYLNRVSPWEAGVIDFSGEKNCVFARWAAVGSERGNPSAGPGCHSHWSLYLGQTARNLWFCDAL